MPMTKTMLRRLAALVAAVTMLLTLSSCNTYNPLQLVDKALSVIIEAAQPKPDWLIEAEQYTDYAEPAEFHSLIEGVSSIDSEGVQYDLLTEPQQTAYAAMYKAAMVLSPVTFCVGECNEDDIAIAYAAFLRDHPEIFWIGSSYGVISYRGSCYVNFVDEGSYGYLCRDADQRDDRLQMIERAAKKALNDIYESNMDEYERVVAVYDWVCTNIEYDNAAADADIEERNEQHTDSWNLYNPFIKQKGVCVGYSKTFQYLCAQLGVECSVVVGDALNSEGETDAHMWNVAKIDGKWYYFDPTWDSHYGEFAAVTHLYFGVTDEAMGLDHTAYPLPDSADTVVELQKGDFNLILPEAEADLGYYERTGAIADINKTPDLQIAYKMAKNDFCCEIKFTDKKVSDKEVKKYLEDLNAEMSINGGSELYYLYQGCFYGRYIRVNDNVVVVKYLTY